MYTFPDPAVLKMNASVVIRTAKTSLGSLNKGSDRFSTHDAFAAASVTLSTIAQVGE
jgi:hypothetical protein